MFYMGIFDIFKRKNNHKQKKYIFERELFKWNLENKSIFQDEYRLYELSCCPYCGVISDNKIDTSKKCTSCKEKIVVRTNKQDHRKLLLTEKRAKEFDKMDEKRKEILFMEKQMNALSTMFPNYMYKFYETYNKTPDMSARDYTFSFENWLTCEIDRKTYHRYMKYYKSNSKDKIIECDEAIWYFKKASNVLRLQAKLVEYKNKDDVLLESIVSLLYRDMTIAHLPYLHWPDRPFSKSTYYADAETNAMPLLIDYMEKHKLKIEDMEGRFMERAHPFIINIISKEKVWPMIVDAYYHYLKLKATGEY